MQTFTDANGRIWTVRVTVDTCRKVAAATGYKLLALADPATFDAFNLDLPASIQAVYFAASTDGKKPTLEEFEEAIHGDVITSSRNAFFEALADFFQKGPKEVIRAFLTLQNQQTKIGEAAMEKFNQHMAENAKKE